uniref:ENTH domain-containing protein n=1 Tax=Gossypium raimondii TaxID=29730 RepID=A0A0D2SNG6_GOSRA|nr:hypothetical protein B456_010G060800 [Gossypium raimondii]
MSGGGTQNSLRKALGAIKDTTTVSLAKVNSDYKELDIAIVKATNHYERPAREKNIRAIFAAISATRPRADVAYCIHALARRLSRTHNWAVALKTLIVIHRALREVDPTFHEELINYERFIKIEQPPASFLQAMEEYVREAPRSSAVRKDQADKPKEVLAIEYKKTPEEQEKRSPSPPPPEPEKVEKVEEPIVEPPDLLGLNDPVPVASELDEKNALALAIVPVAEQTTAAAAPIPANGTTGWELALVTAPSSNENATAASKLAGGLDKLTLDSLYDDAIRRSNQNVSYNPWEPAPMSGAMMQQPMHDPFYASNMVAAPHSVQIAAMANQQQAFMFQQQQQQQQMMMAAAPQQQPSNPFGNYGAPVHPYSSGMPVQTYNPYTGGLM